MDVDANFVAHLVVASADDLDLPGEILLQQAAFLFGQRDAEEAARLGALGEGASAKCVVRVAREASDIAAGR